ncbi:hypothetical protein NTGHW29_430002 [Candidatus Nitrotoga sp. HW29]|nr:hypothetical protein NTGHW29_430002 [Candidatus Nitrotoga sp. HW29]
MFIHRGAVAAACHLEVVVGVLQFHEVAAGARKNQQKAMIPFYSEPKEIRNCYF